ncbi:MAG: NUDIX domain-containing protein [Chloroflexota bacterium]|nr:MAG: NUDIX domain-containing protein [Chloroflexota bacterium]
MIGTFSAGIGALIVNEDDGNYLILKRSPKKDYAAGAWECVTGRVDQGEGFEDALHREVREELDIEVQPLFVIGTTHFYRGSERPENELVGIVYCCSSSNLDKMRLSHEHTEYRWVSLNEARELLSDSDLAEEWLITVIERAEAGRRLYPEEMLELHRREGFELDS